MGTLENWKVSQAQGYFDHHPDYVGFPFVTGLTVDMSDIEGLVVVEIGCGYGRETRFLGQHAKRVYAIDVSEDVFIKLRQNVGANVTPVLAENWKSIIPDNEVDYARSVLVFQHLTPEETADYIDGMFKKLKSGGMFDAQFMLGPSTVVALNPYEPGVVLTEDGILSMFSEYVIVDKLINAGVCRGSPFAHMRVRGSKGTPRNPKKIFSENPEFLRTLISKP